MTMFESGGYDIPTLIEKLRDQRFDGYDAGLLASEVEKFRQGAGTASMGSAVEALKGVVSSLAATDATLRKQLSALGVTWQSQSGGQASAVLAEQAGFAGQAFDHITQAAQLIFDQGEAFNRTKNKLPDPEALRQGEDGYTFADSVFSLFGFETDHASAVKANTEARAQAVEALNAYAHDSGNYLASSQAVPEPQALDTTPPPPPAQNVPSTGSPGQTAPIPDLGPTVAASAKDVYPAQSGGSAPRPAPAHAPGPSAAPAAAAASAATPPIGMVAPPALGSTSPQSTSPSFATPLPDTETPFMPGGGYDDDRGPLRPGRGGTTTETGPGGGPGTAPPGSPGQQATGAPHGPGGGPGGVRGVPVHGGGPLGGRDGGEAVLGKGKMVGSTPPTPSANPQLGPGFSATRAVTGVGGVADGVTALGAGAVGGAVSGDQERRGRGFGRGTAAERGKAVRPLDIGDLPEEEARRAAKANPQTPSRERTRAILEPAATQDGEQDGEHVRRFGVDDRDLFTDRREVAPDLIGDHPVPDDR
ncbi:hypothetical protein [Amycolatopsis taiwanensis]|uniref:PPE family domain-containing protein n=1 Tax=Amycolatopsis taiwanensis TaxID=342230 RepID=A0A9W6R261_9PSEU|nr:hypothetical protein [Amycolatopsis taiwanensis]GLY67366.1 hypothetical protein Atai01_39850 [Amycolatopsis taiwanensis]